VRDTGPGFHAGPGAPLAAALQEATNEARELDSRAGESSSTMSADVHDARPVRQQRGEGIGLSIVKRLCELLDASLELESAPGEGTTFRVVFPRRYPPAAPH
jgi:signal transduction histidine kinase